MSTFALAISVETIVIMDYVLSISSVSVSLTVCLFCGILLWMKRREVHDYSRTFLSLFAILVGLVCVMRIFSYAMEATYSPYGVILPPFLSIFGIFFITLFMIYPIEVMRPGWLRGWNILVPFIPTMLISVGAFGGVFSRKLPL